MKILIGSGAKFLFTDGFLFILLIYEKKSFNFNYLLMLIIFGALIQNEWT